MFNTSREESKFRNNKLNISVLESGGKLIDASFAPYSFEASISYSSVKSALLHVATIKEIAYVEVYPEFTSYRVCLKIG